MKTPDTSPRRRPRSRSTGTRLCAHDSTDRVYIAVPLNDKAVQKRSGLAVRTW